MKKAFVNCWIMPGGVLDVFINLIKSENPKQAEIFAIFSDRKYLVVDGKSIKIITALPPIINNIFYFFSKRNIFILSSLFDYRNLMFFYKILMKRLSKKIKKYGAPKVIISSFAIAKNLEFCRTNSDLSLYKNPKFNPITVLYIHSPMQYIWSHYHEYLQKLSGYKLKIFKYITPKLKKWDKQYTKFDKVYSNSHYTSKLVSQIYNIDSIVRYPEIDSNFFDVKVSISPQDYYVYVGRLVRFVKELDKVIKLFNHTGKSLIVMGTGPDEKYLKSISSGNIIFVGWIKDPLEKIKIIKNSLGLINITKESFGIATVEALLLGVPVFAYNDGASPELIDNQKSGILIPDKKQKTLLRYFNIFQDTKRDRDYIQNSINEKLKHHPR